MSDQDYGPKTGASKDHPYNDDHLRQKAPPIPPGKDISTPPDNDTDIDSEADIGDPSSR